MNALRFLNKMSCNSLSVSLKVNDQHLAGVGKMDRLVSECWRNHALTMFDKRNQ